MAKHPLLVGGGLLRVGGAALTSGLMLYEPFTGTDGTLASTWTEGHAFNTTFSPCAIKSNALAINGFTNNTNPVAVPGPPTNYSYNGIGCIWQDFNTTQVQVSIKVTDLSTSYREATPLLHVVPGTGRHGLGAWLSSTGPPGLTSSGVIIASYIANPCTDFGVQPSPGYQLATGTFARGFGDGGVMTARSTGTEVFFSWNGTPITLTWAFGGTGTIASFPVDASLQGSTKHGIALDTHFDVANGGEAPMITDAWFTDLS